MKKLILISMLLILIIITIIILNNIILFKKDNEIKNINYQCINGYLKYEDEKYIRDIWVGNMFQIKCKKEKNNIIIL